jgi:hypothetical protein
MRIPRSKTGTRAERIAANNEWMRRFIEEPERFEREFQTVDRFLTEKRCGKVPSHGERIVAYEESIVADLRAGK